MRKSYSDNTKFLDLLNHTDFQGPQYKADRLDLLSHNSFTSSMSRDTVNRFNTDPNALSDMIENNSDTLCRNFLRLVALLCARNYTCDGCPLFINPFHPESGKKNKRSWIWSKPDNPKAKDYNKKLDSFNSQTSAFRLHSIRGLAKMWRNTDFALKDNESNLKFDHDTFDARSKVNFIVYNLSLT